MYSHEYENLFAYHEPYEFSRYRDTYADEGTRKNFRKFGNFGELLTSHKGYVYVTEYQDSDISQREINSPEGELVP